MTAFKKVLRIGTIPVGKRRASVFVEVGFTDGRLSLTGVVGPDSRGNALGSCGQIDGGFAHRDPADDDARTHDLVFARSFNFAPGWTAERWLDLLDVWTRWHLNDMRAGCEHQRAAGWGKRPIDPSKPTTDYGRFFEGQKSSTWNLLGWVRPDEHPDGLLTRPCEVCGYEYGTSWLREEVPAEVIAFLAGLPETDKPYPWAHT